MRSVFAIFFLILFGVAANIQSSYYYYWKLNQQEITREFCENLDKPELKCNGKCHLMKTLTAQEPAATAKKEPTSGTSELRLPVLEWIAVETDLKWNMETAIAITDERQLVAHTDGRLLAGFSDDCTHPPDVFV